MHSYRDYVVSIISCSGCIKTTTYRYTSHELSVDVVADSLFLTAFLLLSPTQMTSIEGSPVEIMVTAAMAIIPSAAPACKT